MRIDRVGWTFLCLGLILLALGFLIDKNGPPDLPGAPVPLRTLAERHKQAEPPLLGEWMIHWQGGSGRVVFHKEGGYTCFWCGQDWIGWWELRDGILTVTEAVKPTQPFSVPNWYTWKGSVDSTGLGGALPSGGKFTLTPMVKREED